MLSLKPKTDITTLEDIKLLVDSFYTAVRQDELLSPIFNEVIKDNWPIHLEKMYRFWQTVLLDTQSYFGSPFVPHAKLPIYQRHFDRWLELWTSVIDNNFIGPTAEDAKWRAGKMATMFLSKLEYYRNHPGQPLV